MINEYRIKLEDKTVSFKRNGRKAYPMQGGFYMTNGEVELADKTRMKALLVIDSQSSGEHWDTGFMTDNDLVFQDDKQLFKKLGKTKEQIFPYRYRYFGNIPNLHDFHIQEDGWSSR